jgi:hypothetical protein
MGSINTWESVSGAWDRCLHEYPRIEHFSSNDYRCHIGEFKWLSDVQREAKIASLAEVIASYNIQGIGVIVPHAWFSGRDKSASKGMVGTRVYDWGFIEATAGTLQWLKKVGHREKVDFVFDSRSELKACISLFDDLKKMKWLSVMENAGQCTSGDDKDIVALQMADLLCGEFSSLLKGNPPSNAWRIMAAHRGILQRNCDDLTWVADGINLQRLASEVQRELYDFRKIMRQKGLPLSVMQFSDAFVSLMKRKAFLDIQIGRYDQDHAQRIRSAWREKDGTPSP